MTIERDGAWRHDGEELRCTPGGGLLGADVGVPGPARPVRRGRHRAGPARAARRAVRRRRRARLVAVHGQGRLQGGAGAPPACRRSTTRPCARRAGAAEPDAVLRELAVLGLPVFVKPARLGSSVGIAKAWARGRARRRARRRVRPRRARDRRGVLRRAWRSSARCSATASRRPRCPGEIVLPKAPSWYDYEAKYSRRRDGAASCPPRLPDAVLADGPRGSPSTRSCASAAPASPGSTSSSRASACSSTSSTRCPASPATSVYPKLWEATGLPFPELCDRLLALARRALRGRERAGHALLRRVEARLLGTARSRRSRRAAASGGELRDPDEVVAVRACRRCRA